MSQQEVGCLNNVNDYVICKFYIDKLIQSKLLINSKDQLRSAETFISYLNPLLKTNKRLSISFIHNPFKELLSFCYEIGYLMLPMYG